MKQASKWAPKTAFAEAAEALGVATDHVMAVSELVGEEVVLAIYTPDTAADPIWFAVLRRDEDGIYRVQGHKELGSQRALREAIERGMGV